MEDPEEIKEDGAQVIVSIDKLRQELKEDLESEGLDSIDDVKDLILEMYEVNKGPQPLISAKRTIMKCQALLDKEMMIQTRMIESPYQLLRLNPDEELT